MKFISNIKTDIVLIVAFAALIVSGVGVHLAGEIANHHCWHAWAVAHVIAAAMFLVVGAFHIKGHWPWFKTIATTFRKKSKPTLVLTLLFLLETVTGVILLAFTDGANSHTGLWHWWTGIILAGFGIGHLLKRLKPLKTGLKMLRK